MPLAPTRFVIKPEHRKHERKIPKRYFCGHINIYITLVQPYGTEYCPLDYYGYTVPIPTLAEQKIWHKVLKCVHLVGSSTTVSSRHEVTSSYGPPPRPSNRTTHRAVGNILIAAHVVASPSYAVHQRYIDAPQDDQSLPILRPRQESVGSDKLN
jgi:hypothetical protein